MKITIILWLQILIKSGDIKKNNIIDRYNCILDIITNDYQENILIQQFGLQLTPLFYKKDFEYIINNYQDTINYNINGIYIHHNNNTYLYIINKLIPNKPTIEKPIVKDTNEIVLKITKTNKPDIYNLFCNNNEFVGIANIPSLKCSKFIKDMLKDKDYEIVECGYHRIFNKWEPTKISTKEFTPKIDIENYIKKK